MEGEARFLCWGLVLCALNISVRPASFYVPEARPLAYDRLGCGRVAILPSASGLFIIIALGETILVTGRGGA